MNFKASEKLHAEKRSIRPFLAMEPRLALVGAKLRRADASERWRGPTREGENMAREIRSPPSDTPPVYNAPPHRPKARHHLPPFELSIHSCSPATKVRDGLF
jgi:hypothetical protein